jgi:hypothetical protein
MKVFLSEEKTGLAFSDFKEHDHSIPQDGERILNAVRSSSKEDASERIFSFNRHSMDPDDGGSTFLRNVFYPRTRLHSGTRTI